MNNNKKNGGFYAENSRNGCADISTFGNYFRPKLVFIFYRNLVGWATMNIRYSAPKQLRVTPTQLVSQH